MPRAFFCPKALLKQLEAQKEMLQTSLGVEVRVVAATSSSTMLLDDDKYLGLDPVTLAGRLDGAPPPSDTASATVDLDLEVGGSQSRRRVCCTIVRRV